MLRVIGISGSPRQGGNSETLLSAVLAGTGEAGAGHSVVRLSKLRYRGCQGCDACQTQGECVLKDDLAAVHRQLREANLWVLAAPIYYDGVCGQMKLFFDRLRPFSVRKLPGRRAGLILITYEDKEREDYARHARVFAGYLGWFGDFRPAETFCAARLGERTAAKARADLLRQATEAGGRLASILRSDASHR
jgi:multimeric flavodoxin WrbA